MDNFREWLSDNLRYILLGLAIILILTIAILAVRFIGAGIGGDTNGGNSGSGTGTEAVTPCRNRRTVRNCRQRHRERQ